MYNSCITCGEKISYSKKPIECDSCENNIKNILDPVKITLNSIPEIDLRLAEIELEILGNDNLKNIQEYISLKKKKEYLFKRVHSKTPDEFLSKFISSISKNINPNNLSRIIYSAYNDAWDEVARIYP